MTGWLHCFPVLKGISGEQFGTGPGWALARAIPKLNNTECPAVVRVLAEKWKAAANQRAATNPWGVHYPPEVSNPEFTLGLPPGIHSSFGSSGKGGTFRKTPSQHYYLHRVFPDLFGKDAVFSTVDFVLGTHPANNRSYVFGRGGGFADDCGWL